MIRLNLNNLIRSVRSQADKDFSGHITDSQLTAMIEQSWSSLYDEIVSNNDTYFVKKYAVNIRNKENYFPYNFSKLVGIDRHYGGTYVTLGKQDFPSRAESQISPYGTQNSEGGDCYYSYTYFGNKLKINSIQDKVDADFVIYYVPEAPSVSSGNAFVQKGWDQWIIYDVAIKANIREESGIRDLVLQKAQVMDRIKIFSDSRDHGSPPKVIDVRGGSYSSGYGSYFFSTTNNENLNFDDLLVPFLNEKDEYPVEFLETYTAKALYYEFDDATKTAYIGFLNEEDESQWCVVRVRDRKINYGIFSENTDHNSLEGAWADRLNLTYIQSITVVTEEETVSVTPGSAEEGQMQAPHVLFGWSQDNITDVTNVDNASFVRFNSPYGSNITIPASGLSQAYFLVGVSNEGRFDQFSIGGLDQVGIFLELGVENGYRYYISENPLLPEFFGNRTVTLGISDQGIARGSVIPSEEGSAPSLGNISLKLLWSNDEGYPDVQGDGRVASYSADSEATTISGEFHDANSGLKVYRGNNSFWVKDEEIASNGDISSVLSEFDDSGLRTVRPALTIAGKITDIDAKTAELILLKPLFGDQDGIGHAITNTHLYKIDIANLTSEQIGSLGVTLSNSQSLTRLGNTEYALDSANGNLYSINKDTGLATYIGTLGAGAWNSLAGDEDDQKLYTINESGNPSLYRVDPNTVDSNGNVSKTLIKVLTPSGSYEGLAFLKGILKAIKDENSLCTIDKSNGNVSSIRLITGLDSNDSGRINNLFSNGIDLFAFPYSNRNLYRIDEPTSVATKLGAVSGSVTWSGTTGFPPTGKPDRYSRYAIPQNGLPTLASETNDANSGTLSRVVGGDEDVLVCRETSTTASFYVYNQSDNTRASSLDFNFTKNTGETVRDLFYTESYLNIILSDGTDSRTVVYKREASSYVRQSSLDKSFTGVDLSGASFSNKKLFRSEVTDDMSGGGSGVSGQTILLGIVNDTTGSGFRRFYTFVPSSGDATEGSIINPTQDDPNGTGDWRCLASKQSTAYSINQSDDFYYSLNKDNGVATSIGNTGALRFRWTGLAFIGSNTYGLADYDDKLYGLGNTGSATLIGELNQGVSRGWIGLADIGTLLYSTVRFTGRLYSIDPSNASATDLGVITDSNGTVIKLNSLTSIGVLLYGTSTTNKLYSIVPSTRIATEISSVPANITALTRIVQGGA